MSQPAGKLERAASTRLVRHPLVPRDCEVRSISRLTPGTIRLVLGGSQLRGFVSLAPDDHVKLVIPSGEEQTLRLPQVVDGRVDWSGAEGILTRDYTPVNFDTRTAMLELHVVAHPAGSFSRWVAQAKPGARVGVLGPRGSHLLKLEPLRLLLVADDTGLPAVQRWLSELLPGCRPSVVCLVRDRQEIRALPSAAQTQLKWLSEEEGHSAQDVIGVLEGLPELSDWSYSWLAGEASLVQQLRRYLVDMRGVSPQRLSARGYWKRGRLDHQEPHED